MSTAPLKTWIQQYGSITLAAIIAFVGMITFIQKNRSDTDNANRRQDKLENRVELFDTAGSSFERETRQTLVFQAQTVAEIKLQAAKALDLLATQREATVRMEQQIAYLVSVCGKPGHAAEASTPAARGNREYTQ